MNDIRCLRALALLGVLLIAMAGCGDEDPDGSDGSVGGRDAPNISVNPGTIDFAEVSIGAQDPTRLTITNTGRGELRISNIELVDNSADGLTEFHRGEGWKRSLNLKSGESHELVVIYRPLNRTPDTGYIEITSNNPGANGVLRVPLSSPTLAPKIFSPSVVQFSRVPAGQRVYQVTQVQNIGQAPLRIDDIALTGAADFTMSFPTARQEGELGDPDTDLARWPATIAPNEQFLVRFGFEPINDEPRLAEMIVFTNDPLTQEYVVSVLGNSGSPCLSMNYERGLDFGASSIGQVASRTVVMENCSTTTPLRISAIELVDDADGVFELREGSLPGDLPDEVLVLNPRASVNFAVSYTPENEQESSALLRVSSNDPAKSTLEVPLSGSGTNNACPVAVAEGRLVGSTRFVELFTALPLNTVELTGSGSYDPDGNIQGYEWTVITRPDGSTARPSPSADIMEPTLYLDLAGTYEIELVVYDNQGLASCERSVMTIHAVPQDDVHIQLIWDAPAVINPAEGNGTDLDLHYLHPLGRWNEVPYDIFWNNRTADWGQAGDVTDNPRLDIDDTFKGGPENINHSNLEIGIDYGVGVYYFADRGFGAAYATVRIYIRGELRFEVKNRYMPGEGYFWYAAIVRWPSTEIVRRDRVDFGFPTR
ncbi:MAG: choice-of-anchor D domain-containing protein [Bradymonadaceae bacterium]|nr:choice-of-anchor D domain-containing protein [Lujinxingiaceae bacterium]